jgi:hypothetical protein
MPDTSTVLAIDRGLKLVFTAIKIPQIRSRHTAPILVHFDINFLPAAFYRRDGLLN